MRRTLQRAAAAVLTAALALGGVVALGVAPASAASASFSGTVEPGDPVRGYRCGADAASTYDAQPFVVSSTGAYALTMTSFSGDGWEGAGSPDLYFSLHRGSIGTPCIAEDDDGTGTYRPSISSVQLAAGQQYILVTSHYAANGGGTSFRASYSTTISGPGDVILGNAVGVTLAPTAAQQQTQPISFTATFAEAVTGFDASDVVVSGVPAPSVSVAGGGTSYQIQVSGATASGAVGISIPTGAASADGRPSLPASTSAIYAPAPSVTIQQSATQADPASTLPVTFDVRFSEAVTGFVAGDVTVTGTAAPGGVSVTGSGASYLVSVAGAQRPGTIEVAVPANVAQTSFGTGNLEATSTDRSVTFVPSAPVATISTLAATTASVPVQFAVEFDGPVDGFEASDVLLGGTAQASGVTVSGSGASYVASIADAAHAGTITAQVRGIAVTRYTLTNAASETATAQFAPPRPTATIEQSASQSDPTTQPTAVFDVRFSEPVTGLTASDLVVGGTAGATQVSLSGADATYVATVTGATRPGTITLALPEAAATSRFQETSLASTSVDGSVAFEPLAPSVSVSLAEGQASPTTTDSAAFLLTFSEPVAGLEVDDLVVDSTIGGQASIASTDGGSTYVVRFDELERAGDITLSVRAAAVENVYGLANEASNAATVTFAPERPSVTVDQSATQADAADVDGFVFDVVFSQPVSGLEPSDFIVGGTAGATIVALTGDGGSYVVTVSGATQPGTVTLALPEGAATGAFETASEASTSTDAEVTFAPPAPTVTVEQGASQADPTDFGFVAFDVTFSHDVTGLEPESFVVGGTAGGTSVLLEGSGAVYRAYVADMTQPGTVTLALAEGAAVDRYGLASLASTSVDAEVQFAPPAPTATVTRADGQAAVADTQPFVFDVSFSVPVSGFDAADVVVSGDAGTTIVEVAPAGVPQSGEAPASRAAADVAAADDLGYDWTVRVSGATAYGVVAVGIREGAVVSGYGLENAAVEPTADSTVVYAPAVVAPAPTAPAPVAPAPVAPAPIAAPPVAPAPVAALPRTGEEPLWALALAAMLVLAIGSGVVRRRARRG